MMRRSQVGSAVGGDTIYRAALPSLCALLALFLSFTLAYLFNEDIWWYLKTGETVLAHGGIPEHDDFLYPLGKQAGWVSHSWLWTVLLAALHRLAGLSGVVVFGAALVGVLVTLVFTIAKLDRYGLINTLVTGMLIIAAGPRRLILRAELATWVLVVFYLVYLERGKRFTWRSAVVLTLLQWLWCNLHGSWPLGVLVVIAYSVDGWWPSRRNTATSLGRPPLWFGPALLLTTLLTPHITPASLASGLTDTLAHLSGGIGQSGGAGLTAIMEWKGTFSGTWPRYEWVYGVLLTLGVGSFFVSRAPGRLARALIFGGMAVLAFAAIRFVVGLGITTAAVVMLNFRELDPRLLERLRGFRKPLARVGYHVATVVTGLAVLSAAVGLWITRDDFEVGQSKSYFFTIDPMWSCPGAADFITNHGLPGPIFNDPAVGGYLTGRLYPKHRLFIDSRVLSYAFMVEEYLPALSSPQQWHALENRYQFRLTALGHFGATPVLPLIGFVANDPRWQLAYIDPQASVFVRTDKTLPAPTLAVRGTGIGAGTVPYLTPNRFHIAQAVPFWGRIMRRIMLEVYAPQLLSNYLLILGAANQPEAVDDLATRALEKRTDDVGLLNIRGLARVRMGRAQAGIRDLRESIRLDPEDVRGYIGLALALHSLGQHKAALGVVEMGERLEPSNPQLRALRQQIQTKR